MSKQLKINELKRVVNVDKFTKYAQILQDPNTTSIKEIELILKELNEKTPSREVLMKTRLGFVLKDVSNRESLPKNLREQAKQLRAKWKEFHKKLLLAPNFDVKCDKPTTENRQKARQALVNAFVRSNTSKSFSESKECIVFNSESAESVSLIADLEFTVFQQCDKLVSKKYFTKCRQVIRLIGENARIRNRFLNGEFNAEYFVKKFLDEANFSKYINYNNQNTYNSNEVEIFDNEIEEVELN
jgi:hypothetical protein